MSRRESYINNQFGAISSQFQDLFDQLGLSSLERDERERQICTVIAQAMEKYLQDVTHERDDILQECRTFQTSIKEMANSLQDVDFEAVLGRKLDDTIAPPYNPLLDSLRISHNKLEVIFTERLEKDNILLEKLKVLATEIDGISVPSRIMPAQDNNNSLNLSNESIDKLNEEVIRWEHEKKSRFSQVTDSCSQITQLWVELGTPQNEIDSNIVKANVEKIGIKKSDLNRLADLVQSLNTQRDSRIEQLTNIQKEVTNLWARLSEDNEYVSNFEKSNRGISQSVIENYQKELDRLSEKKKQHIHLFIQDARRILEDLWNKLYFSEQEMALFTPAWTDTFTDASLDAHENEIERLKLLVAESRPILSLLQNYKEIQKDEDELNASMHDSSRLLSKGPGRRDPGRLLKEEQMRKRIAKNKPKILTNLKQALIEWEKKSGKAFQIHGEDLMDVMNEEESKMSTRKGVNGVRKASPKGTAVRNTVTTTASGRTSPTKPRIIPSSTRKELPPSQSGMRSRGPGTATTTTTSRSISRNTNYDPESPIKRGMNNESRLGRRSPVRAAAPPPRYPPHLTSIPTISRIPKGKENKQGPYSQLNSIKVVSDKSLRIVSSSTTGSSENWETYESSSEDDEELSQWREGAMKKLVNGVNGMNLNDNTNTTNGHLSNSRLSEFNWDKDTF